MPRTIWQRTLLVILLLSVTGCGAGYPDDKIDPTGGLTRDDYIALRNRGGEKDRPLPDFYLGGKEADLAFTPPPIPDLPDLEKPKLSDYDDPPEKLVSLSVTDTVPLRDVLIELGREGDVNIEIDPRIKGGIIFTAKNQPFEVVLRRICDLAALRYEKVDAFIRIELDEPYQRNYALDYLSLARQTKSDVSISTNVFDMDVAGDKETNSSNASNENNSTSKVSSTSEAHFWKNVSKALPQVMATSRQSRGLVSGGNNGSKNKSNFSIDKQAGLITVFGNSRQHNAVRKYLRRLYQKASAQVLIEARIVEVELAEGYQSGVNWSQLLDGTNSISANFGSPGLGAQLSTAQTGLFTASLTSSDFSGILNLVRTFGATRVLSSPRLTVINNQTAVLKVARNEVYFVTSAQFPTTINSNGAVVSGTPVFSSTPKTVPVGLVMTVQPAINTQNDRITMTLRPTISRVIDRVTDPSIGLNAANAGVSDPVQSQIPVLAVREMDSVLQLQSGEVAILGGLMQDSSENQDQGAPPFDDIPLVGELAKSRDNNGKTSELVVLLRATIQKNPIPDSADRDLYDRYHKDPRPFNMSNL